MHDGNITFIGLRNNHIEYYIKPLLKTLSQKEKLKYLEEFLLQKTTTIYLLPQEAVHGNVEHLNGVGYSSKRNRLFITQLNYEEIIYDLEIRSFFEELFLNDKLYCDYDISFLFLVPISQHGYNFGQFRLASHLIKLGYKHINIQFFPLFLREGKYDYDSKLLHETLDNFKPTFVCESTYIGWESEILRLNKYIKSKSDAIILAGGPFTSSHTAYCIDNIFADVLVLGHGEYILEAYLKQCTKYGFLNHEISIPGLIITRNKTNSIEYKPMLNKYLDFLNWDNQLLIKLFKITPVINLFTSEECNGNCVFCYRTSTYKNNSMSNRELYYRLANIMAIEEFKNVENEIYVRFFDDDFFASEQRNIEFLQTLLSLFKGKFHLYELTFSIRSLNTLLTLLGERFLASCIICN